MIAFRAIPYRPQLGQLTELTGELTSGLARQIIGAAEPALRRIIKVERNRFAEAIIGGIPLATLAAIGYAATRYLVPDKASTAKGVGYMASAASLGLSAWWILGRLTETVEEPEEAAVPTGPAPEIVTQAAQAIVKEAEPRVRQIVDEERERLAVATQISIPFFAGSFAAFLATLFLAKDDLTKAVGYSATALLAGTGAWFWADRIKEAA